MKVLVTYYSETGNTEKLAKAIFEGAGRVDKELMPIDQVGDLEKYELIFCGFPVHSSSVPGKVQEFLKRLPEGKKLALFATHGSLRGGQLATTAFDYATSLAKNTRVIGTFGCRGKVKQDLLEALLQKPEHRAWAEEAQSSAATHPDDGDLEDGKNFAQRVMDKAHFGKD
ncbi:MAG: flavodoxin domain-containing protein [Deltaproteobacteria bacterium]|nr:flavodoxin domain-containing protein [Deltaproteobacteria bacterium]MBW2016257.1 flavodoxin domain-containing protein [Deltaproteobacteria bacterium]MBW2128539.1 flavodoxin domain-containing protein [Deltaproteobacteria bacterium]MBW2303337.1 flavodoxin domain-containing protein [Deltaproteobacteria bacterium]